MTTTKKRGGGGVSLRSWELWERGSNGKTWKLIWNDSQNMYESPLNCNENIFLNATMTTSTTMKKEIHYKPGSIFLFRPLYNAKWLISKEHKLPTVLQCLQILFCVAFFHPLPWHLSWFLFFMRCLFNVLPVSVWMAVHFLLWLFIPQLGHCVHALVYVGNNQFAHTKYGRVCIQSANDFDPGYLETCLILEPHESLPGTFEFKVSRLPPAFQPRAPVSCFKFLLTAAKRRFSSQSKKKNKQRQQREGGGSGDACTNCTHFTAQLWLSCGSTDITVNLLHTNDALFPSDFLVGCRQHFSLIDHNNKKQN